MGDLISSLPTVRALGGGVMVIRPAQFTRVPLTPDRWNGIDLLLKQQDYITDVEPFRGQTIDYDLNRFRITMTAVLRRGEGKATNLADWHLQTFGQPTTWRDVQWLAVEPNRVARVVINRTGANRPPHHIYHNRLFPWRRVMAAYGKDAVFIGTEPEYQEFTDVCGDVPYHKTENLLEAARVIEGADLFIGNQSSCLWLAHGLFKRTLMEVWLQGPNSSFDRQNVTLCVDNKVVLPNSD